MLLQSIYDIINQQLSQLKSGKAGLNKSQSTPVEKEKSIVKMEEIIKIPASEATFEAAAKAEGMKKIELEIAAAAGLLRPISPEPPAESDPSSRGIKDLLRMIDELKNPPKSPGLDLFE